jgi:hypothetical protein
MTATNLNVGSLGRKMSSPIAAQFSFILMFRTIQINLKTQQIKMLHRQKSEIEARFPQPCNLGATSFRTTSSIRESEKEAPGGPEASQWIGATLQHVSGDPLLRLNSDVHERLEIVETE